MMKRFDDNKLESLKLIHDKFHAIDVRQGEAISAEARPSPSAEWMKFTVWRLSPVGIELVDNGTQSLKDGEDIEILLNIGSQTLNQTGTVVSINRQVPERCLVGIQFAQKRRVSDESLSMPIRKRIRWQTHAMFYPIGWALNPARFNDKLFFRVANISKDGMLVATSLRNKFIVPGLILKGSIDFPNAGKLEFRAKVSASRIDSYQGKDVHLVGLEFAKLSKKALKILSRYILNFASNGNQDPTPLQLTKEGYGSVGLGDSVEFDYAKTEKDYQQVLQLRSDAFRAVEGLGVTSAPHEMADTFDDRSRIIIARFRDQIVATMRLVFHGPDDKFEEEQYVKFPDNFPPRHLVVEASRAATHPDFRGADLFINLVRYSMLVTLQSGCKWTIQSTYGALVPMYKRIGFKDMNMRVPHPVFPGEELHLLLGEADEIMTGKKGSPLTYQLLVPHIEQFLARNGKEKLSVSARLRLALWKRSNVLLETYKYVSKLKRMINRQGA